MAEPDPKTSPTAGASDNPTTAKETRTQSKPKTTVPKAGSAERPFRDDLAEIESHREELNAMQVGTLPPGSLPELQSTAAGSDKDVKGLADDVPERTTWKRPYGSQPRNIDPKTGNVIVEEPKEDKRGKAA